METTWFEGFSDHHAFIAFVSIGLNVLIAITGVLPSTFITIGTIGILDFTNGLIILMIGESLGAIVNFVLYRKGLNKLFSTYPKINHFEGRYLNRLKNTRGLEAFFTIILLRILPFVPSGAVTLTAALSKIDLLPFSVASTLGKIPSLIIEAYSAAYIFDLKTEVQLGLVFIVVTLFLFYLLYKKRK